MKNNKLTITLELTDKELTNLQSLVDFSSEDDTDIYYRYETLEKVVKCIFSAKEYEDLKEKLRYSKSKCKCGHEETLHSLLADRLCSAESCPCFKYVRKEALT